MTVRRFDYRQQYQQIREEILSAMDRVLDSGCLILGPRLHAVEEKMCRFLNTLGFAVGVGNGTDAIAIALRAMNIGSGDEVITVSNTAIGTVAAIRMVGATPVFCDIDPATLLMDAAVLPRRVGRRTRAIIPVHLFGNAVDMPKILDFASKHGLGVIEDCAQSCGTLLHNRATGTWGNIGCFSFYPTKNLGAYGDGGMCFTRDSILAGRMRQIRSSGCDGNSTAAECEGVNSRLDELQAAILEVKLQYLDDYVRRRRAIARAYADRLSAPCVIPATTEAALHSHHLFVIQVPQREKVIGALTSAGIEHGIHYPLPIHLMNAYRWLEYLPGSLPVTENAARQILTLPCYPELPIEAVHKTCDVINEVLQGTARSSF
jgi:dTDP-4-amino-4,6-dideoxygalactose transaminase